MFYPRDLNTNSRLSKHANICVILKHRPPPNGPMGPGQWAYRAQNIGTRNDGRHAKGSERPRRPPWPLGPLGRMSAFGLNANCKTSIIGEQGE